MLGFCLPSDTLTVMASSQQVSIQISFLVFPYGCFSSLMNDLELSLSTEHLLLFFLKQTTLLSFYRVFLSRVTVVHFEAKSIIIYAAFGFV